MTTDYPLFNALLFAVLGVLVFLAAFGVIRMMIPGNLWKGILEERNVALAVMAGLMCVAVALIIAATMH